MADEKRAEESTQLAVLTDRSVRLASDIKKILEVVEDTSASMISCTVKVEALDKADLTGRLTKVETREKIFGSIAAAAISFVAGLSLFKESIMTWFK